MRTPGAAFVLIGMMSMFPNGASAGTTDLTALVSGGSLGDFAAYLTSHSYDGINFFLNTDSGTLIAGGYNPSYGIVGYQVGQFTPSSLIQAGGPALSVFNFSAFDLPQNYGLTLYGNAPAVILSNAGMQIAGLIQVWSNGGQGGTGGSSYFSSTPATAGGGPGGGGAGGNGPGYLGPDQYGTGGSGGGGGMVSRGGNGPNGSIIGGALGGNGGAAMNLAILAGGGGGGGGGGCYAFCNDSGRNGGNGGGAAFFGTPLDFLITATGGISADGWNGAGSASTDGSSGGGAGGYLAFGVAGNWTNNGAISARGAVGGGPANSGSGGYVLIDPLSIVNNGLIDVADGNGGNALGGLVILDSASISGTGSIEGSIAPEPGTLLLSMLSAAGILLAKRRAPASTR